jgi:hypothetical protein
VVDDDLLGKVAKARARVRRHVWDLLHLRPGGFPWLVVAGKRLTGWIVIDIDATLITAHSVKDGAAVTFKRTWGFHPLAGWCANTTESLAMLFAERERRVEHGGRPHHGAEGRARPDPGIISGEDLGAHRRGGCHP